VTTDGRGAVPRGRSEPGAQGTAGSQRHQGRGRGRSGPDPSFAADASGVIVLRCGRLGGDSR
jgi:hypothetical protein